MYEPEPTYEDNNLYHLEITGKVEKLMSDIKSHFNLFADIYRRYHDASAFGDPLNHVLEGEGHVDRSSGEDRQVELSQEELSDGPTQELFFQYRLLVLFALLSIEQSIKKESKGPPPFHVLHELRQGWLLFCCLGETHGRGKMIVDFLQACCLEITRNPRDPDVANLRNACVGYHEQLDIDDVPSAKRSSLSLPDPNAMAMQNLKNYDKRLEWSKSNWDNWLVCEVLKANPVVGDFGVWEDFKKKVDLFQPAKCGTEGEIEGQGEGEQSPSVMPAETVKKILYQKNMVGLNVLTKGVPGCHNRLPIQNKP